MSPGVLALLVLAAFLAGVVDAIAGGGGLVTLPALLATGLPPHVAIATNKGQAVFGVLASYLRFRRAGMIDAERARVAFPAGFAGSLAGAALLLHVSPQALKPLVLALLLAVAAFLAFRRPGPPRRRARPLPPGPTAAAVALVIGCYDGFFGPGTGTFLIVAFVALLGDGLAQASASAKVVNLASNLAAFALFAWRGTVLWHLALPMAAGQMSGSWVGAHLAVKRGDAFVRKVVLAVVAALVAKLGRDLLVR